MKVVISSGHSKYVRGASGYIDEVDEARKVVDQVAECLRVMKISVATFHDNTSQTQDDNLSAIVNFHNLHERDLDVSIHFNAYKTTPDPMGAECWYVTQEELAEDVSEILSHSGHFINRGAKYSTDLFFLNNTDRPAILIEVCFVDSFADTENYRTYFNEICVGVADAISSFEDNLTI